MPRSYAARMAEAISGPASVRVIADAGHMAEFDRPDEVADAIAGFLAGG